MNLDHNDYEDLLSNFVYEPSHGLILRIRKYGKKCKPYVPYTTTNNSGYHYVRINRKHKLGVHIAVWAFETGKWPEYEIDHRDGNKINNIFVNLRTATTIENKQNTKVFQSNTSGFPGVAFHKASGKYRAYISINGRHKSLGYFSTPEDAYKKYTEVRKEIYTFQPIGRGFPQN